MIVECRGCKTTLRSTNEFCNLGHQPLANTVVKDPNCALAFYPTRPLICHECLLVQLPIVPSPDDLFPGGYPFYSGMSLEWMRHCRNFADSAIKRWGLGSTTRVVEIGSNDGTMLRRFHYKSIPAVGIEPSERLAAHAQMEGIATINEFWTWDFAKQLAGGYGKGSTGWLCRDGKAHLIIANNVLAHVPNLHDFLYGIRDMLAPGGVASIEVPWIGHLIRQQTFDQIYAEHHCYFSLFSLQRAANFAGLRVMSVEEVPTHGGSIRVTLSQDRAADESVESFLFDEGIVGLHDMHTYNSFRWAPSRVKSDAIRNLYDVSDKVIIGYGASAKAVTMINYLGIDHDLIPLVADVTPAKLGNYIPGTGIKIVSEATLAAAKPNVVVNFCWNWQQESEARIRAIAPDAHIMYLNPATVKVTG